LWQLQNCTVNEQRDQVDDVTKFKYECQRVKKMKVWGTGFGIQRNIHNDCGDLPKRYHSVRVKHQEVQVGQELTHAHGCVHPEIYGDAEVQDRGCYGLQTGDTDQLVVARIVPKRIVQDEQHSEGNQICDAVNNPENNDPRAVCQGFEVPQVLDHGDGGDHHIAVQDDEDGREDKLQRQGVAP